MNDNQIDPSTRSESLTHSGTAEQEQVFLVAEGLARRFNTIKALDGVSFELRRGELLGLVGPNGAGKTTLLRILTGLETAFEGRLAWEAAPRLGFLPQSVAFGGWRTARETLGLLGLLSGMGADALHTRIPEVLAQVDLIDVADRRVGDFSGGMRQRLGLAQALLHEPDLLVLDEPFNHLDPGGRIHLKRLLANLKAEGTTILLSSHILSDVEALVDRVAVLNFGRLHHLGSLSELQERQERIPQVAIRLRGCLDPVGLARQALADMGDLEALSEGPEGSIHLRAVPGTDLASFTTRALTNLIASGARIERVVPLIPTLEEMVANLGEKGRRVLSC